MSVQLHTLPGPPESGSISASINIRWIHLHGDNLDFAQFRTACLNVPDLPERIQRLASKTLDRIEKEKLKMALDGMFIDPGTVLRGEEKHRPDPFSVIFSCVPYFSIHAPSKSAPPKADRLHPVRSLMQSYYPYEPVKERDMEQAYRKFSKYTTAPGSSGSSNSIIHVPVLWILNLGDRAVVTCGPQSLAEDFVKSITVMQEDLKLLSLGSQQTPGSSSMNDITNIRLLIPDGRVLLYSLAECETYFEMEQKIREISPLPGITKPLLVWNHDEGEDDKLISSADWPALLKTRNRIFINLTLVKEYKPNGSDTSPATNMTVSGIPPFFHWPHAEKKAEANATDLGSQQYGFIPAEMKLSMHCLEQVEKGLMAEKLDYKDVETVVERNFTSNRYYQTLPENKLEDIRTNFVSLLQSTTILGIESSDRTFHQNIVNKQCSDLTKHAAELVDIVYETIKLFVSDVDKGTMLRKVWGAMTNVSTLVEQVQRRGPCRPDAKEFDDTRWIPPLTNEPAWYIRTAKDSLQRGKFVSLPVDEKVEESLKKCRSCRRGTPHISSGSALRHLRVHIREGSTAPAVNGTAQNQDKEPNLKDWIRNADQRLIEETNAAYLAILIPVVEQARGLLAEARELANGVKTIEGKMSDIYFLPHELLKTLRRLIVFYLAVERAFHYTDENFEKFRQMQRLLRVQREDDIPSSAKGLNVLERFGTDAKNSLLTARKELCMLAKAPGFQYLSQRLSLSPQYLCAWFMRRLIVRPVDSNGMTVTDMYRDYLSRLQFQVNHRPGKRLLRSLNLIQEELAALERVNQWQSRLINSYCTVLDDSFYQFNVPSRRAMFAYERQLLSSCLENLADARDDCAELIRRCGPLSESTKQSAEINEEDHGKAILVFTVVTIIFLPLSFVTSYLGMNTSDIRDMENKQSLFWQIALPLTAVTMGTMLFIAYNGEDLRRHISSAYRKLLGKQDTNVNSHGISVAQRRRASRVSSDSTSTFDYRSLADEAEL
ncbi:hypothetical protein B0J11DRAFT_422968 [Dendryphion nanum]|uniref:Uncharacterized protein n=1 Tax=Dendryphion nanum TaxID=256645 RepID=A0A9P9J2L6_9PLEO|nr:hypothetical protein B0J11DRAFT_422968 [Dendryphion nanum]